MGCGSSTAAGLPIGYAIEHEGERFSSPQWWFKGRPICQEAHTIVMNVSLSKPDSASLVLLRMGEGGGAHQWSWGITGLTMGAVDAACGQICEDIPQTTETLAAVVGDSGSYTVYVDGNELCRYEGGHVRLNTALNTFTQGFLSKPSDGVDIMGCKLFRRALSPHEVVKECNDFRVTNFLDNTDQAAKSLNDVFSLGETIGKGQFGVARKAVRLDGGGDTFAVKTIQKCNLDFRSTKLLRSEIKAMIQIPDHPNVVKFHGVFEDNSMVHLVLE
jgi:hypothetical protein